MRRALVALTLALLVPAAESAAQTATTGGPQTVFTRLLRADDGTSKAVRAALDARRAFVDPDVLFSDLTGDGKQDAVVRVTAGGAGGALAVYVFSADGASGLRAVYRSQRLYRALVRTQGNAVLVRTPTYQPSDEPCCPATLLERTLTWSPKAKRMVLRSTRSVPAGGGR